MTVPFSVLDRSRTRQGREPGEALRDTVAFAREAEALGYHRFWVSEHHSVPGVAGSAPTVLAAAVAGATSRIRVGTGGVMLPNHRTLVVAEQFGVLESLFPGRIDMGLGRSVGFTDGIRRALGADKDAMGDFGAQLAELAAYFTDGPRPHPQVHARPAEGLRVPMFVLANESGAERAAEAGAALVIGGLKGEDAMLAAIERYRAAFRPSAGWPRPHVMVAGNVAVAETSEAARRLLVPEAWSLAYSRTHGVFPPLLAAEEIEELPMTEKERGFYEAGLRGHIHGTQEEVGAALAALVGRTGADEVLVTTSSFDRAALLDSYRRLAALAGPPERPRRVAAPAATAPAPRA
ncbi:LLM class flavin-dependent oxidoreductase [Streptomyces cinnamoneus]|uniref:LLM class flavin-dependent oxidoreductase n=1 Tax=Streptomyces cinnamoneus TaxID=53446 RepID=A0A2G1XBS8_STRCJ|nr:LLM class flavin-dependent oxidoreductase [Streptomyces cinnamoneus]PHQ48661.1 LLM class flavin-dependent oxidoreductase [Streptomyces cinnamoneus]PPT12659.1 LLM class flavin-dependent oxidoreductase [Streptomyces cinnamoneus]